MLHSPVLMRRRVFILILGAVATVGAAWFGWTYAQRTTALGGPIILISVDTLRADHLPIYGYKDVETPAIDALAADGLVFDQAWAHSPQTMPSHSSILTGLLPFEHGVRDNMGFLLKPGTPTLASRLHDRGFASGGFVSAYVLRKEVGIGRGFDAYDDKLPPASPEVQIGDVQRDGADTVSAALAWLAGQSSSRLFLFLHLYEPHTPYSPPDRFKRFKPYDGEIAYSDELIGRVVTALKQRRLYDNALIIFLSDHGEGLGDHGEVEHGLFLYRETIRVPLVIKLPGSRRAGTRVATPVQHIDLVPTVLDLVRAPRDPKAQGRSLTPLFDGGTIPEHGLYAEAMYPRYHFGWSELYALTDARYRFIRAPRDELYDIVQDPTERRNIAADRDSTRAAMRQGLERVMAGATIEAPAQVTAEDRDRLKALGYIGAATPTNAKAGADSLPDPKDKIQVLEQYRDALQLVRGGRQREAIVAFQAIVAENPMMADVWNEIAGLLVHQGRLEEAVAAYKKQVDASPHDPAALVSVAQALIELGKLDEAKQQGELALRMLPDADKRWRASAHKMLMRVALAKNQLDEARAAAQKGQAEDPSFPLPDYLEGLIRHNAGQFDEALPYFEKAVRAVEGRPFQVPDLRYYLGDTLGRLERYDEAEKQLREEVRQFPMDLRARAGVAMLCRAQGRTADSDKAVAGILAIAPTPQGFALAEKLWTMFGEPRRAADVRSQAKAAGR
ncbi:MAG: sulfatase-like hydrolase/transferase [Acidobacteriota bacterium]